MLERGELALQLLSLYGKLRRAQDAQVRESVKAQIDALVGQLGNTTSIMARDANSEERS